MFLKKYKIRKSNVHSMMSSIVSDVAHIAYLKKVLNRFQQLIMPRRRPSIISFRLFNESTLFPIVHVNSPPRVVKAALTRNHTLSKIYKGEKEERDIVEPRSPPGIEHLGEL